MLKQASINELAPLPSLAPVSEAICNRFETKRIHFGRRRSHQNKQLLILHLDGVICSVKLTHKVGYDNEDPLQPISQQLMLRHECMESLAELQQNFQLILFSFFSEALTNNIVQHFKQISINSNKVPIEFDGIYSTLQNKFNEKKDGLVNYNQVYIDFGVIEFER